MLLKPGQEGAVQVEDVELIVVASGFEGASCSTSEVQRARSRTRRTSE